MLEMIVQFSWMTIGGRSSLRPAFLYVTLRASKDKRQRHTSNLTTPPRATWLDIAALCQVERLHKSTAHDV